MFHVPRCLAPSLSWLARACHFTSRVIYPLPCTLFCYVFDPLCTGYTLGELCFAALEIASTAPIATATASATAMHDARPTPRLRVRVRE